MRLIPGADLSTERRGAQSLGMRRGAVRRDGLEALEGCRDGPLAGAGGTQETACARSQSEFTEPR